MSRSLHTHTHTFQYVLDLFLYSPHTSRELWLRKQKFPLHIITHVLIPTCTPVVLRSLCVACSVLACCAAACAGMLRSWLMISNSHANGFSIDALCLCHNRSAEVKQQGPQKTKQALMPLSIKHLHRHESAAAVCSPQLLPARQGVQGS